MATDIIRGIPYGTHKVLALPSGCSLGRATRFVRLGVLGLQYDRPGGGRRERWIGAAPAAVRTPDSCQVGRTIDRLRD
jgi:hypothetical protein